MRECFRLHSFFVFLNINEFEEYFTEYKQEIKKSKLKQFLHRVVGISDDIRGKLGESCFLKLSTAKTLKFSGKCSPRKRNQYDL